MEKMDSILLFVGMSDEVLEMVQSFENDIKLKCGASKIKLSNLGPAKKHEFHSKEKIKGEEFDIWFDKV